METDCVKCCQAEKFVREAKFPGTQVPKLSDFDVNLIKQFSIPFALDGNLRTICGGRREEGGGKRGGGGVGGLPGHVN